MPSVQSVQQQEVAIQQLNTPPAPKPSTPSGDATDAVVVKIETSKITQTTEPIMLTTLLSKKEKEDTGDS